MKRGRGKQGIKVKQNWPYTCNDCYYVTFRRDHFSKHILRHKQQHSLIGKCTLAKANFLSLIPILVN